MTEYLDDLKQDPFDPEQFVERLAWRISASIPRNKDENITFDPFILSNTFEDAIRNLQIYHETLQIQAEKLINVCREEEKLHWQKLTELQNVNKEALSTFQELDERINFVATKIVHLGDQLESVNTPRARAVEAQKLMIYFAEFLSSGPLISEVFTDRRQLYQAADVILKLYLIVQELTDHKFEDARKRINEKYQEIEKLLREEFIKAFMAGDKAKMKEIAAILSNFEGYSYCIETLLDQSQQGAFLGPDIFVNITSLCRNTSEIIKDVFSNPEQVMAKLVQKIFTGKLQDEIHGKLGDKKDSEKYLKDLYDLYSKTVKLSSDLSVYIKGKDNANLNKIVKNIFHKHLQTYISEETQYFKEKCRNILHHYYESKDHSVKQSQGGGIQEIYQNIQASINNLGTGFSNKTLKRPVDSKTGIIENRDFNKEMGGNMQNRDTSGIIENRETNGINKRRNQEVDLFLSVEVSVNILQESKTAFKRCHMLSHPSELASNAERILDLLFEYLIKQHIETGIAEGLKSIPTGEQKSFPEIYFFDVVRECNDIIPLIEKQFTDCVVPLIISTPKYQLCLDKKKRIMEIIELKLDNGIDRSLNAIIAWIKNTLLQEQKKDAFQIKQKENQSVPTLICKTIVTHLKSQVEKVRDSLDGENEKMVLLELGIRFHYVLYKHFQKFQYTDTGTMLVTGDADEYRKCIHEFQIPFLNELFDTLHLLCSLLCVKPEHFDKICHEQLGFIDKSTIETFRQLRPKDENKNKDDKKKPIK